MLGKMKNNAVLLGTSLKLSEGQFVRLIPATNIPPDRDDKYCYFAKPFDNKWSDGIDHDPQDSILIREDEVEVIENGYSNRMALSHKKLQKATLDQVRQAYFDMMYEIYEHNTEYFYREYVNENS